MEEKNHRQNDAGRAAEFEAEMIVKGIEISWTTWGRMRGERLITGPVSYLKAEGDSGFERIYSVDMKENQELEIPKMISLIKAGILPDSILITPMTRPSNLAEILANRGFIINEQPPCMLLYLDNFRENRYLINQYTISEVTKIAELKSWLDIINKNLFEGELVTTEQFGDVLRLDNTSFYLGFSEGRPVSTCMTISDGDTAVLEMAATLKDYRCRGFASCLIGKALADLQEKGIRTVSLRAEEDGVGVYTRLGFKACFNRVIAFYNRKSI